MSGNDGGFRREPDATRRTPGGAGLCDTCVHARRITSAKGSEFVLCELSVKDDRYRRYPPLPVLSCDGYQDGGAQSPALRS